MINRLAYDNKITTDIIPRAVFQYVYLVRCGGS